MTITITMKCKGPAQRAPARWMEMGSHEHNHWMVSTVAHITTSMMTSVIIMMMMMVRFDWADGEPNNYEHHEMCLALWEQHDPFFPIVRSFYQDDSIRMISYKKPPNPGSRLQVERCAVRHGRPLHVRDEMRGVLEPSVYNVTEKNTYWYTKVKQENRTPISIEAVNSSQPIFWKVLCYKSVKASEWKKCSFIAFLSSDPITVR